MPNGVRNLHEGRAVLAALPNLPRRIENFLDHLDAEPCTHPGLAELNLPEGARACIVISNMRNMCPACRLRLLFFHTIFNGSAYDETLGKEPGLLDDRTDPVILVAE